MSDQERVCTCGGELSWNQGSFIGWYECLNCHHSFRSAEYVRLPFREITSAGEPKPYNTDKFKFKWKLIQH